MTPADLGLGPDLYFVDSDPARPWPVVARRADGVPEFLVRGGAAVPLGPAPVAAPAPAARAGAFAAGPGGFSFCVTITPPEG